MRPDHVGYRRSGMTIVTIAVSLIALPCFAQTYPAKPIRIVTAEPGGGNDFTARTIGQAIGGRLGQPWVVDNRGGAGGLIAAEIVARAPADGYTLLVYAGNIWTIPLLQPNVRYDPLRDFAPISWAARSPNTLVVHPSLLVKSVQELIALARAKPGALSYGSGGTGASTHFAAELFKSMTRTDILRVTYRGNGPALTDLVAGNIQVMFSPTGAATPHVKSGRVRAIAVTSIEPTPLAPGLPTIASAGLPGYESIQIYGVYAPAKTAEAIVRRLNEAVVAVVGVSEVRERFLNSGMEPVGSTPAELASAMKTDMARLARLVKEAGIRE
ncbi:MAG TPA: tripartite tricarboxylate transporter substrate binding protein [Burkholderiales bacterium]|nr:tripartite tricarboxylate transporter substrate binding protein [Burkholderiales bacterium]